MKLREKYLCSKKKNNILRSRFHSSSRNKYINKALDQPEPVSRARARVTWRKQFCGVVARVSSHSRSFRDRQTREKQIRASWCRCNETRINIAITDSRDFPALNRRAYIFVRPALSSAGLIKVLYQATSLLRLLDAAEENGSVYLARNINYLIGSRSRERASLSLSLSTF